MKKFYVSIVQRVYEVGHAVVEAETEEQAYKLAEQKAEWEFLECDSEYDREFSVDATEELVTR